jgi:hypothetical protein
LLLWEAISWGTRQSSWVFSFRCRTRPVGPTRWSSNSVPSVMREARVVITRVNSWRVPVYGRGKSGLADWVLRKIVFQWHVTTAKVKKFKLTEHVNVGCSSPPFSQTWVSHKALLRGTNWGTINLSLLGGLVLASTITTRNKLRHNQSQPTRRPSAS